VYKRESPKALKMMLDKRKVGFIGSWGRLFKSRIFKEKGSHIDSEVRKW